MIQNDLGVYTYNRLPYSSTLSALVNLGLSKNELSSPQEFEEGLDGQLFHDFGETLGSYIGQFMPSGLSQKKQNISPKWNSELFSHEDLKAKRYLRGIFNGPLTPDINAILFLLYLAISFNKNLLNNMLLVDSPPSNKIKYLTNYHVIQSLYRVQSILRSQKIGTSLSEHWLVKILSDKTQNKFCRNIKFRNTLVHYGISDELNGKINEKTPFYGLIEHYFPGRKHDNFINEVNRQSEKIYLSLTSWLKGVEPI